ncbi:MAG TPA: energy transducer TonB [Terriglobales bacterium]|jgi:TonB family protein|nr:energy transducer TonB [Terriglobales bacterium]
MKVLFSPLPEPKSRWTLFLTSYSVQTLALLFVINLNLLYPARLELPARYMITSLVPYEPPVPHTPQPVNPRLLPRVTKPALEEPPVVASLTLPPLPKAKKPEAEIRAPELKSAGGRLPNLPAARPVVKVVATNTFSTGSSAMPTTTRPAAQVQTGGFGDPNGVPAQASNGRAVNINALGAWNLPSGPGRGNGTGGASGVPGVVASAGFGNGVAVAGPKTEKAGASVKPAGFADSTPAPEVRPRQVETKEPPATPVEILAKPKPNYTEEGRKLKIEGEVRLEVEFTATGEVHVIRILQGLGHGLDEQAVRAAKQIKFKPAQRQGKPVDSTATLHIIFQLA